MKNILITGGAGFVGCNLIERLLKINEDIFIISLDNYSSGTKNNHVLDNRVMYIEGNTWEIKSIKEINEFNPDIVFHFGEFSRIHLSFELPNNTFWSNTIGTQQILDYCIKKNAKLIYSCSSAVFNDEDSSPYVFTKYTNINLIKNYNKWFGLKYAITYFYNVYGNKHICEGPYSTVIGIFEKQYKNNMPLTVVEPGNQSRIFTHIDDIVSGLILIAEKGEGDKYLLSSNDKYSILEVVNLFKTDNYIMIPKRKGDRITSVKLESRTENELGWMSEKILSDYISSIILDMK
jgi:UDP-glucose 4-epimerase